MSAARTHFVYRVYDDAWLLLYVGCTGSPENRLKQHRADRAPWLPYAHHFRMEGPYTKATAFAQEKSVIVTEEPFFNSLPIHLSHNAARRKMAKGLRSKLHSERPDLFPSTHDPVKFAEYMKHCRAIETECDRHLPEINREWRLANYLNARRREVVRSA